MTGSKQQDEAAVATVDEGVQDVEAYLEAQEFNEVRFTGLNLEDPEALTFEAAMAALASQGYEVTEATPDTVGDGFTEVDKEVLLNRPMLIINWEMDSGRNRASDSAFYICRAITRDGMRVRFTAGGYGLAEELVAVSMKRRKKGQAGTNAGLMLPKGLSRDQVEGTDADGKPFKNWIYRAAL